MTERSIYENAGAKQFLYSENIYVIKGLDLVQCKQCVNKQRSGNSNSRRLATRRNKEESDVHSVKAWILRLSGRQQLRSADEGHTLTFECMTCKTKWNVNT